VELYSGDVADGDGAGADGDDGDAADEDGSVDAAGFADLRVLASVVAPFFAAIAFFWWRGRQ
ncbi:hypothetical protein A2U01_0116386, partial [Trifolium medium]|nr:hypothetical protein [Trifolium medium]